MLSLGRTTSNLAALGRLMWQLALCAVFGLGIFAGLAASHLLPEGVPRYDFMLLVGLGLQVAMLVTRLESRGELVVICLFHALGLGMELFKVGHGSWTYPEFAYTKIGGVPLYSGFMYASVASFLCQAWRRFDVRLTREPPVVASALLAALIYVNFFSKHFVFDIRYVLMVTVFALYARTRAVMTVMDRPRAVPLPLVFVGLGLLLWLAENIATLFGAWQYPDQARGWQAVDWGKFGSWFLLIIVSFLIVAALKRVKAARL